MEILDKKVYEILERERHYKSGALNISNMGLKKIPAEVFELNHLNQLNLWKNNIQNIPAEIGQLTNLKVLDLTSNRIQKLPKELSKLINLDNLFLGNNNIIDIEYVYSLKSLKILLLGKNQIHSISKDITKLNSLRTIILSGNAIQYLPPELCHIKTLNELLIKDNPLENIPIEYSEKDIDDIRYYFLSTSLDETTKLYESKLLIVGEPFAGKTSLCKKVLNPDYKLTQSEKSTQGIEVFKYIFSMEKEKSFTLNMWDFGGQEIYHSTHHFFLTKRSLYILLTDNRADNTDFDYWLNVIELLSNQSPVLIVQNEKQGWKKKLDENRLRTRFKNLISVSQIDLSTNKGLNKLLDEIKFQSMRLPHIGNELPKSWVKIREELESLGEIRNFISYVEYIKIFNKYQEGELYDPKRLSDYFHDLGIFLHFKDNALLSKLVILNTSWSTNAVYSIISSDKLSQKNGRIGYEDFLEIWKSNGYNEMYDELLELMLKFELCYKIEDSKWYIFPKELPFSPLKYPESYRFDAERSINIELTYPHFMPKGILTRFIVKMNINIERQDYVWRDSVLLKGKNSRALVIEQYSKKKIIISVAEKRRNDLLAIILNQFNKVHGAFKDLVVTPLIPCRCKVCKNSEDKSYYNYDELRDLSDNMVENVICTKSYASIDILKMLNLYEEEMDKNTTRQERKIYQYININGPNTHIGDKLYIEKQITEKMKIDNLNISGGNQQFADKIINQYSELSDEDRDFIRLVCDNTKLEEEQKEIVESLGKLKSSASSMEEKKNAKSLIKSFMDSGVKEISKSMVNYLMKLGIELIT